MLNYLRITKGPSVVKYCLWTTTRNKITTIKVNTKH